MSVWTSIEIFVTKPVVRGKEMFDRMVELIVPDCINYITRTSESIAEDEETYLEEEFFTDIPIESVSSYYQKGKRTRIVSFRSQLSAKIKAIVDGFPQDIRGNFCPDGVSVAVGLHDVTDWTSGDEKFIARVHASMSFGGYGSPNNTKLFRKSLGESLGFQAILKQIADKLGMVGWVAVVSA